MRPEIQIVMWSLLFGYSSSALAQQSGNPFESVSPQGEWTVGVPSGDEAITTGVTAEQSLQPDNLDTPSITIGAVSVNSSPEIPGSALASSYERFIGQEVSEDLLRELASAVSEAARDRGYICQRPNTVASRQDWGGQGSAGPWRD